jgi:hypothetical protein
MSKTAPAAAEPIDVDNEVDIDNIDLEQEGRDADRLFTNWVAVDVEVLPCTLLAPVSVPVIVEPEPVLSGLFSEGKHSPRIKPTACV